jgi:HEAT repeat protein
MVQREVIRALGQIAGAESLAFLVDCLLHDPRVSARIEAARALEKEGGAVALKALSQAATSDVEALVRTTAKSVLASHTVAK